MASCSGSCSNVRTANVLFAVEATRRWSGEGISANAVHPGAILDTNLTRHYDPEVLENLVNSGTYTFKTREQGAATSVLIATSPPLEGIGGRYFEDCNEAHVINPEASDLSSSPDGVAAYALDPGNAKRLWEVFLDAVAKSDA
jgi:NAD(P)-dependent dehydrogenase (short-subunit alcohol dehydrogenase family)